MGQQIGGWDIVHELGEGGQGKVFLARSPASRMARDQASSELSHLILNVARQAFAGNMVEQLEKSLSKFTDSEAG